MEREVIVKMTKPHWFNFDTGENDSGPQEQIVTAYRPYLPLGAPRNLFALLAEDMNYGVLEAFIHVIDKMGASWDE